jgi:class 3 adenylate cyclase
MIVKYRYNTLEDYLISTTLNVDGQLDDGWGAMFPVKGREIEATILFCDIAAFSKRTLDLSPTETLVFVNNFFAWISAEALRDTPGIIDKYIGDEMMVIFSHEFGSEEPFIDAVQVARWMCENDAHDFSPHIGIASGPVTVGYVGTPLKYNCSVFGSAVALAARCAAVKPDIGSTGFYSSSIVFPAAEWKGYEFEKVVPRKKYKGSQGESLEQPQTWELLEQRTVKMKNIPNTEIRELIRRAVHIPQLSAEDRARMGLEALNQAGRYWPSGDAANGNLR